MQSKARDMTKGSPVTHILLFSLPLMLGSMLQQVYNMSDAAIVSRFIGLDAMSAIGASDWFNYMVISIVQGLTHGFSILVAQRFGDGDHRGMRRAIGLSVTLCAVITLILTTLSLAISAPALRWMNTPDSLFDMSLIYNRILFGAIPITMLYNLLSSFLRSLGDSKTPLWAMVVGSVVNIVLDLLFILVFHWGVMGAAVATVIGQACASLYCLLALRKQPLMKLSKADLKFDWPEAKRLLKLGVPVSMQNAVIGVGGIILQAVINGYGPIMIGAFVASFKLYGLIELAGFSFGYAVSTFVGQNMGANLPHRIKKGTHIAMLLGFGVSAAIGVLMLLFGQQVLGLFIPSTDVNAAEVMQVAYRILSIMAIFLPVLYVLHVYRSALQGLGNTFIPMLSGFAELIMRVGAALLLPRIMGVEGLYYAEVLAWAGAALLLVVGYYQRVHVLFPV